MIKNSIVILVLCLLLISCVSPEAVTPPGRIKTDIVKTQVQLSVDLETTKLNGKQEITFIALQNGDQLYFDSGPFLIRSAMLDETELEREDRESGLYLHVPNGMSENKQYKLTLLYEVAPPDRGILKQDDLISTIYFACDWMICNQEDFSDRFLTELVLDVPSGLSTLGPGQNISTAETDIGRSRHIWRTSEEYPAYVHGFAVGLLQYRELSSECDFTLEIAAPKITEYVLAAFEPTCAMLTFFEQKAGMPFPRERYTQLYVPGSRVGQEAISHSVIGGQFLDPILETPTEDWLIAHELAHQWWGNGVTAADLSHFWLNEGIVTFLVAAWKEERWGQEAYEREIELARDRWQRWIEQSGDVPIAFDGAYVSLGARRSIQYSKGAVFLDELRKFMGDRAFWAGFADFTREGYGKGVTSQDFEDAMQSHTDMSLAPMFTQWVYKP